LPKDTIVAMSLENSNGHTKIEYDMADKKWWLVDFADPGAPPPAAGETPRTPADQEVISVFLRDLQQVPMARQLPGDSRDIGEVQLRLSVTSISGQTKELRVGDAVKVGDDTYWFAERDDYPSTFLID